MAETKVTYAADAALTLDGWNASLAAGEFAMSTLVDNTSNLYVDALVGGVVEGISTTGTIAAGETFDIYIIGTYSNTATDLTGAIDALLAAGEEGEDVSFVKANLNLFKSIQVEATTPDVDQGYHFGPIGVAQFFGGIMPKKWALILHNNTGATLDTGSNANYVGITYTTA